MIVQAIAQVPHELVDIQELLIAVKAVFPLVVGKLILHIERLGHVQSIQPDLVGIDLFVPEIAGGGSGLFPELAVHGFNGLAVLFPASEFVEVKKSFSRVYIVKIVFFRVIGGDSAILPHKVVNKPVSKFQIFGIFFDMVQFQDSLDHAAVYVVP